MDESRDAHRDLDPEGTDRAPEEANGTGPNEGSADPAESEGWYRPRYESRAVDDPEWIRSFLRRQPVGVLGTVARGEPFLAPLLFVYDADTHAVFLHLSPEGRTVANVRNGSPATFAVFDYGRLLPAEQPVAFSIEYESVIVHGPATVLEDSEAKRAALGATMAKFAPHLEDGADYEQMAADSVDRTAVIRLDVEHWSGKQNAPEDPEGAYAFANVRRE